MLRYPENNKGGKRYHPWPKGQGEQCYEDLGRTRPLVEALWSWRMQGLPGTHWPVSSSFSSAVGLPMADHFSPTLNPQSKEPGEDAILEASLLKTVVREEQMKSNPHGDPRRGGKGLWWQRPGPGAQIEWEVSPSPQCLFLFLPITDRRAQSAGLPLPQALAVPVPITSCRLFLCLFLDWYFLKAGVTIQQHTWRALGWNSLLKPAS